MKTLLGELSFAQVYTKLNIFFHDVLKHLRPRAVALGCDDIVQGLKGLFFLPNCNEAYKVIFLIKASSQTQNK
jgi:hypothetical protein